MTRRPPPKSVKCLLPVWGRRHTRQFLEFGLPTLLAPGNVPALAAVLPCEFVIATATEDMGAILEHPNWRKLSDICPVRLAPIDDLICDASHATSLTLAYARMIRATGAAMTDCCFLFLVADFLLADGSLGAVLKRLQGGASGVLAGNFQVTEEMAPLLAGSGVLSPRELVRLSLAHLHPDTSNAIVDGDFRQTAKMNRLFWRADEETLLGRFYLAHMIGIRPEATDFAVGSSADYGFIPELCPSGNVEIIADSDEYFTVEMQPPGSDAPSTAQRLDARRLAADLSRWTTAQHRRNAETTIVFHANDVSPSDIAADADATIREIAGALSPAPCPHRDHPYWIGGLALHRATTGRLADSELGYRPDATMTALKWRLRLLVSGRPPSVRPWHPRALDFALARKALAGADRILVVAGEPRTFAHWLRSTAKSVTALSPEHVLEGKLSMPAISFDAGLVVLTAENLHSVAGLFARIAPTLSPHGRITILVTGETAAEIGFFAPPSLSDAELAIGIGWDIAFGYIEADPIRRAVQQRLIRTMRAAYDSRPALLPFHAIAWAGLAAASYLCNLAAARPSQGRQGWCSSAVLTLQRTKPVAVQASVPDRRNPARLMALCAIS